MIFLNLPIEISINNCKNRLWEPDKYQSAEQQTSNLLMLEWVKQYPIRNDEFSLHSHRMLFEQFAGNQFEQTSNERPAESNA